VVTRVLEVQSPIVDRRSRQRSWRPGERDGGWKGRRHDGWNGADHHNDNAERDLRLTSTAINSTTLEQDLYGDRTLAAEQPKILAGMKGSWRQLLAPLAALLR